MEPGRLLLRGETKNPLQNLRKLGADEVISLQLSDEDFKRKIKELHNEAPVDIIIDYIWGHSVELILSAFKGDGTFSHKTKLITVGGMSGDIIQLSSQILRATDIQISGSGLGSWTEEESALLFSEIIPEMFQACSRWKNKDRNRKC